RSRLLSHCVWSPAAPERATRAITQTIAVADDEWDYEAVTVFERLWGFRLRPGERGIQPGGFSCVVCGISQPFSVGEAGHACQRHAVRSEWVWRSGDDSEGNGGYGREARR